MKIKGLRVFYLSCCHFVKFCYNMCQLHTTSIAGNMIPIINEQHVREAALANGFTLKLQPNGTMDLDPHVYQFARALLTTNSVPCTVTILPATIIPALLPNCMCYTPEAEKFCRLGRQCSKAVAYGG